MELIIVNENNFCGQKGGQIRYLNKFGWTEEFI